MGNSNAINAELKEVYAEYADRGFEIYQIGVDVSKDIWINAVQEQQLPWISVCDFRGRNSPALGLYNVQKLPANFLIDREGIVVARDLYGTGFDALRSSPETYRMTDEEIRRIESEYWAEYRRIKHEQIKFIVEHKSSLAGVYALYQRLPGETYLFNLDGDVIYYRMVAEAIEERYPESSYLPLLASEIARMDARQNLMSNIAETNFPDVELPDMFGRKVRLSSLQG